jgi:aspartyl-tRNA synthetase
MLRTHACGDLNDSLIDHDVTLCGWLHRRRDHGGLTFFDLRDRSGLAQIVFDVKTNEGLHQQAKTLGPEDVLRIMGTVRRRPKGTENPQLTSGTVEVKATALSVLNAAKPPPLAIDDEAQISDEVRMQWRYLDLRRPSVQRTVLLRHRIVHRMRQTLDALGFVEVETPILTKSTPEGARDFLVPSRLNPGQFYALPQSPQLFKQLLMIAGLERYFQMARCFRDEDLRADRQPEFTQLDLEMSFVEEADVFAVVEAVLRAVFQQELQLSLSVPFPRLTFREAQSKHGTDKPDLHTRMNAWAFCWITEFPLFRFDEQTRRWDAEHHPFTAPYPDDEARLAHDPATVRARAYDLILNGVEVGSGSIRIHKAGLQREVFKVLGLSDETVRERFEFLLEALTYGAPPHGGIALGLDRFLALIAQAPSIRDVIAFPKTQKAIDPLTGAPSEVSDAQLKELGIAILGTRATARTGKSG